METTIIIPSKGTTSSVDQLKLVMELFNEADTHCIFLQIRPIPDNQHDMMMLGRDSSKTEFFGQSFYDAAEALKEVHHKKVTISTDYLYGDSSTVFRQYVQTRHADLVLYDKQEWFDSKRAMGLNVFNMVSRSGCGLMYISGEYTQLAKPPSSETKSPPAHAPASVMYQFDSLDEKLAVLENTIGNKKIVSRKISHLSRYFLNERAVDRMLLEANSPLLLLKS